MSKNDDLVWWLRERATTLDKLYSHIDADHMRKAAAAIERGAAQGVTHEMKMAAVKAYTKVNGTCRPVAIQAALEAALSATPPAPAPDAGEPVAWAVDTPKNYEHPVALFSNGEQAKWWAIDTGNEPPYPLVRAVPAPAPQPPEVKSSVVDAFEAEAGLSQWHLDNWTDGDFKNHIPAVRAALKAKTDEIERLRRELLEKRRDRIGDTEISGSFLCRAEAAEADLNAVSAAIGGTRFMDPPDGGDVSLAEQVSRMRTALEAAEASNKALREGIRRFAEGNLGDGPGQANYDRIRGVARALLSEKKGGE